MASGGISRISGWIRGTRFNYAVIPVAVIVVFISLMPQREHFPRIFNNVWRSHNNVDVRERFGLQMKENLAKPVRVMARKPVTPYYADAQWFLTPPTYPEVLELARLKNVDYLLLERDADYNLRPALRYLFDPSKIPSELKYVGGIKYNRTGELFIGLFRIED